ncbi:MAG: thiol peroxidase [Deltaproteobacteria bacterium]|nr:thiol peroxidase [Deltaproteobacteria bacterium]
MAKITLKDHSINTIGTPPAVGTQAPAFTLVNAKLEDVTLTHYKGKQKILNIFPSLDTPTCATSVRKFNEMAGSLPGVVVLNISADLPFAQKRFCAAEGLENVEVLSTFRSSFARDYQVLLTDSILAGLCSRAVLVLDVNDKVIFCDQVAELSHEPNYLSALAALTGD